MRRSPFRRRWPLAAGLALLAIPLTIHLLGEAYCRRDFRGRFESLRGTLVEVEETPLESVGDRRVLEVRLRDDQGLAVVGHLEIPTVETQRSTALLILGGIRTGRRTIEHLAGTRGVVLFALDYPFAGKRSGYTTVQFLRALPSMHRAMILTIPATRLAVDYLLSRPDVDPDRIVLIGGSFGAILAPAVAATEPEIDALVVLFGGGDIESLIRTNLDRPMWMKLPAAWLGKVLSSPVEPSRYIGDVSPRPILLLNGTEDLGFPVANAKRLHAAAREPKTVHWIEAGHLSVKRPEFHGMVTGRLLDWLSEQGLTSPDASIKFAGGSLELDD